ncbi:MAG: type II toxin-antitoxin system RelB/DinJ family antitoxin [Flexilinea sp.]|nr:type II toxin-antitoxin system RelB/DinJ family antitoxin [Flexilinea sp.]
MSEAVSVNFKLDSDTKKGMERVCSELGLSMTAAFTIFAKAVNRERRIPFDLALDPDPFYSEANIRYLEKKMDDYKAGKLHLVEHDLIMD